MRQSSYSYASKFILSSSLDNVVSNYSDFDFIVDKWMENLCAMYANGNPDIEHLDTLSLRSKPKWHLIVILSNIIYSFI